MARLSGRNPRAYRRPSARLVLEGSTAWGHLDRHRRTLRLHRIRTDATRRDRGPCLRVRAGRNDRRMRRSGQVAESIRSAHRPADGARSGEHA